MVVSYRTNSSYSSAIDSRMNIGLLSQLTEIVSSEPVIIANLGAELMICAKILNFEPQIDYSDDVGH